MFADVVRSMDIASAVGAERLREIMTQLVERSALVVQRYGGTVNQFTGDGIMAVFGAPTALEDHAFRACLAALGVQEETRRLASEVQTLDGVSLQLRIGLNSGQVIAGEIGSGTVGYTTIGEQVGMAQRMESVAPPGGVVLSEATARLVENLAVLGESEYVRIKGADAAVLTRHLLAAGAEHTRPLRWEPTLIGRAREMNTVSVLLDQSINGEGCVAGVIGPPGIGKSRTANEVAKMAAARAGLPRQSGGRGFRTARSRGRRRRFTAVTNQARCSAPTRSAAALTAASRAALASSSVRVRSVARNRSASASDLRPSPICGPV